MTPGTITAVFAGTRCDVDGALYQLGSADVLSTLHN